MLKTKCLHLTLPALTSFPHRNWGGGLYDINNPPDFASAWPCVQRFELLYHLFFIVP